jgi:predicted metal-dependent phosphoesterase TrpH
LVKLAVKMGVCALGITDHDTLGGLPEAVQAGAGYSLCVIPGIELSVNAPWGSLHLLGYFPNPAPPNLGSRVVEIQAFRDRRNPKIIDRLHALGIPIKFEDVLRVSGGQVIGRPHFAQVMVEMGVVSSAQEAFDRYLRKGSPAYVDRERLDIREAIRLIVADGGIPTLAHPGLIPLANPMTDIKSVLKTFVDMGGKGVEAYAPVHSQPFMELLLALADRYDLVVTGGTDFHGESKPRLQLGIGEGDFLVPDELTQPLLHALGDPIDEDCCSHQ